MNIIFLLTAILGQLSFGWNSQTDADGFKLYKATVAGGPYVEAFDIPVSDAVTATVSNVEITTKTYWVATAYNADGESGYSNEVQRGGPGTPTDLRRVANP